MLKLDRQKTTKIFEGPTPAFLLLLLLLAATDSIAQIISTNPFLSLNKEVKDSVPHHFAITRGPYLDMATESSVNIHWRTNALTDSKVEVGLGGGLATLTFSDSLPTRDHCITISGLSPNTQYYYKVGRSNEWLDSDSLNYFTTCPVTGSADKIRLWVTGDFGYAGANQQLVSQSFESFNNNGKINGWLWLGDNAYNSGTDLEYQSQVFNQLGAQLRRYPLFPAPGNHDYGYASYQSSSALGVNFPYFEIFKLPELSGTEKYYSWNCGNAHFISLDSYGAFNQPGSPMYQWLQNDLTTNESRWTIVYFHHPPYTKGTHDSDWEQELIDMRSHIVPLLETFGVDLVLAGHSHVYERTALIKNHQGTEANFDPDPYPSGNALQNGPGPYLKGYGNSPGTIYIVNGSGSKKSAYMQSGYPHNAMFKSIENKSGSVLLEIHLDTLQIQFIQEDGTLGDDFSIVKSSQFLEPAETPKSYLIGPELEAIKIPCSIENKNAILLYELLDSSGKIVKTIMARCDSNSCDLSLGGLKNLNGIYFLRPLQPGKAVLTLHFM